MWPLFPKVVCGGTCGFFYSAVTNREPPPRDSAVTITHHLKAARPHRGLGFLIGNDVSFESDIYTS